MSQLKPLKPLPEIIIAGSNRESSQRHRAIFEKDDIKFRLYSIWRKKLIEGWTWKKIFTKQKESKDENLGSSPKTSGGTTQVG